MKVYLCGGINSLDDAVRILGIDPSWFRSRIERIAKYVRQSRNADAK